MERDIANGRGRKEILQQVSNISTKCSLVRCDYKFLTLVCNENGQFSNWLNCTVSDG